MSQAIANVIQSKGVRTRQAVLDQAIAQFAAVGLRGASVSSIARQAGLTPSAVYVYFPSKQALFEAAVDTDAAGMIADAVPEILAGAFDGNFGRVFAQLLSSLPSHPLARRVLAGEEGTGAERLVQLPAELRLHDGLTAALRRGQREGTVRRDIDPELCAIGLESIVVALLIAILQTGGDSDPRTSEGVLAVLKASIYAP
jgi:TetR/AcrR family transcriptional regulator